MLGCCGRARSGQEQDIYQDDRFGPTVKRQPPGNGSTSMLFSYSSHSSSATGSRLIARRTGSGTVPAAPAGALWGTPSPGQLWRGLIFG